MSTERDAILIVYPFCLDHVGHGNIQRLLSIARHLSAEGFDVDLVYQASATAARNDTQYDGLRRVYAVAPGSWSSDEDVCARRLKAFYGSNEMPAAHLQPSAALTALARGLIEAGSYRVALATYAWTAPIFANLSRQVLTVCDVQDILYEHAAACRTATGKTTTFSLPMKTERFLWRQWDVLVAITPEDEKAIRPHTAPHQLLLSARHAAATIARSISPGSDDIALFAASDNDSNVQAARWLLQEVWPQVIQSRPTAQLHVVGLICRALPDGAAQIPGVHVLGFRADLSNEVRTAGVIVAPYLYGSGLKIKVVEAACAGKAAITTSAGLIGSGLTPQLAIAVEDSSTLFAKSLVGLLSISATRSQLAQRALDEAHTRFSADACYGVMIGAIRSRQPALSDSAPGIPVAAMDRIRAVWDDVRPQRLVVWGNGSHTRGLVAMLSAYGLAPAMIVDSGATHISMSVEGIAVTPPSLFRHRPQDLIVLSSQTFEHAMWSDTAGLRELDGAVLGLYGAAHVSNTLLPRLSVGTQIVLGIASPLSPFRLNNPSQQSNMETLYAAVE